MYIYAYDLKLSICETR